MLQGKIPISKEPRRIKNVFPSRLIPRVLPTETGACVTGIFFYRLSSSCCGYIFPSAKSPVNPLDSNLIKLNYNKDEHELEEEDGGGSPIQTWMLASLGEKCVYGHFWNFLQ